MVLILGTVLIVRLSIGRHIGHRVPFAFVFFTTIFVLIVHWVWRAKREPKRSPRSATHGAVTELSEGDGPLGEHSRNGDRNHTKSA